MQLKHKLEEIKQRFMLNKESKEMLRQHLHSMHENEYIKP